ncbi:MAG TPA: CRISPR-associated endonuclease Cas2 [Rhodocyclaceae bacterium]|nr:CRISPR-associated endonuclease Cas2 [Rhodocyclaceae bacterium]
MNRTLYLVAYDVCDPRRLHRVCKFLQGYRVGGQKSVFECWVTPGELKELRQGVEARMKPGQDRLHILALDPRMKPKCYGLAHTFSQNHFLIV